MCDFFLPFPCLIFLKVIGAASKEKLDVVKSMGASAVIDYNTDSIKDKVKMFLQWKVVYQTVCQTYKN